MSKEHTEYEQVPKKWMNPKFGSILAGGRYDNLVSAFVAGSVSSNPNSKGYKKALANSILTLCGSVHRHGSYLWFGLPEISGKGSQD